MLVVLVKQKQRSFLQSPARIYGYMALCFFITLTQIFLVIKKKQFEKVQAAEMNF